MNRVYISSTYEDLKDERAAADQAIRALGYQTCSMEQYAASDKRPLAKCLDDVRKCDIYVGIIAMRYGYRPPEGGAKSITHLEYEEARRHGKTILVFLLSEDAPWYPNRIEKNRTDVDALRAHLCKEHCIRWFASEHQLASEVTRALSLLARDQGNPPASSVSKSFTPRSIREVPPLLPYMPDRIHQEHQLNQALIRLSRSERKRPLVCVLHGDERQCHDQFVLRLGHVTLSEILGLHPDEANVRIIHLKLQRLVRGSVNETIRARFAADILKNGGATIDEIAFALSQHRGPIVIEIYPVVEDWLAREAELFLEFLETWADWPDLPPDHWLIICVCVKYSSSDRGFLDRIRLRKLKARAKMLIGPPTRLRPRDEVELVVLEELDDVLQTDVMDWVRELDDDVFGGRMQLQSDVEQLFRLPEFRRTGAMAMRPLASELLQILKRRLEG